MSPCSLLSHPLYLLLFSLSFLLCSACTVDYVLVCVCAAQDASKANSGCQLSCLPLPALHRAVLAWGPRQHSAATTQKPTTHTHRHTHTPNDANFYTQQQQQREVEQQPAPNCCHTEIATARKYNCKSFLQKDLQNYNNKNNNKIKHCNMVTRKRQQQ